MTKTNKCSTIKNERKKEMKGIIITAKIAKVIGIVVMMLAAAALLGLVGNIETSNASIQEFAKPLIGLVIALILSVLAWRGSTALIRWWQE